MVTYRQPFKNEWPITQEYGEKITSNFHTGIDYGTPFGTAILASAEGKVMFAKWDTTGYGNMVIIQHPDGKATCYAHLSDISVILGQNVRQGELVGHSGSTGNSTGPHLHFEARNQWNDYKSHFNPRNLPLMSVDDSITTNLPSKSDEDGLVNADGLKVGSVVIDCTAGAFAHAPDFMNKWVLPKGTKLNFTGNFIKRSNLEFCECELKVFVAVHNGDTQILKNI